MYTYRVFSSYCWLRELPDINAQESMKFKIPFTRRCDGFKINKRRGAHMLGRGRGMPYVRPTDDEGKTDKLDVAATLD